MIAFVPRPNSSNVTYSGKSHRLSLVLTEADRGPSLRSFLEMTYATAALGAVVLSLGDGSDLVVVESALQAGRFDAHALDTPATGNALPAC